MLLTLLSAAASAYGAVSLVSLASVAAPSAASTLPASLSAGTESHELTSAAEAGLDLESLIHMEETVLDEVRRGGFPGAALAVGVRDKVVMERGIGRIGWNPGSIRVDAHATLYDLASLTKVIATTTAVMLLVEDGKMSLDDPVNKYLPNFRGDGKVLVTIRHLLTHTSGLPAWVSLTAPTPEAALYKAITTPLEALPGERVEYSDIGFIVLWAAAESAAGEPLYGLLDRRVFGPLGMRMTTYLPGDGCANCAPTARLTDGSIIQGRVHDPSARALGGIAGNAGLFSTLHDLTRFAAMMANGGMLDSVRVLKAETIQQFTRRQPWCGTRALGWETPDQDGTGAGGLTISPRAFGHTGFTGTSMWIDPDRGTWTILLSNRTFEPRASYHIQELRRTVNDWVAVAYDTEAALAAKEEEAASIAR